MAIRLLLVLLLCVASLSAAESDGVKITEQPDKVRVEVNGQLFTEYHFKGAPHVYFYPLLGPGGVDMTRHYPMKRDSEGEDHDHPHHRSLWYSHGAVNGIDFWAETAKAGKILHDKFTEIKSGEKEGIIRSENKWVGPDGAVVCTAGQVFRVYATPANERVFDFEITIKADDKPLVLGDTKEGSMAVRLAETMRLKPNKFNAGKPTGQIVQSTGVKNEETWGKRAPWCDYSGPVNGKTVGLTIFDHPKNPRHPTWWHVRDYGLFAANPFGIHDFEKKPRGSGDLTVESKSSVTFRYRFFIHDGDHQQGKVEEKFNEYAGK
jgi:hypothetical protein